MNKRSTEGYVLAYVLIVIAVMGMIATTLMTSTLQVITAQENSIQYMKDKYAAMGEVEKLVAELEKKLKDNKNVEGTISFSSSIVETFEQAKNDVTSQFNNLTNGATSSSFLLPDTTGLTLDETCTFIYKISSDSSTVSAHFSMPYTITFTTHEEYDEDPDLPTLIDTDFSSTIIIKALKLDSYEITTSGTTSDEEEGDTE